MVRVAPMASPKFPLDRRELMAGLGAVALAPLSTSAAFAQVRSELHLEGKVEHLPLRPGAPPSPLWGLGNPDLRFKRGDILKVLWAGLAGDGHAAMLNWRGIDGVPEFEPLPVRFFKGIRPMPLRHAGTFLCDLALLGDGKARPARAYPLLVQESEPVPVDRDEVFLVEDWRVMPDGIAITPGLDPKDATPIHTINGRASFEISVRTNERVRLRFINACQRTVIATKIENYEIRVMAIDGQPAEPFQARNGALVLAPGSRTDAFIDVTMPAGTSTAILLHDGKEARPVGKIVVSGEPPIRPAPLPVAAPLPSNGLPERIELKGAIRVELALGGPQDWVTPASLTETAAPAFRAKRDRTVVLALTNRAAIAIVFHLHGHHFRLLDRLDDGWKPFWLDTLAIEPGQTQRIAFRTEYPGRYLIESVATDWAAPRLVRWYAVE
jgi:Multicopper oxidase